MSDTGHIRAHMGTPQSPSVRCECRRCGKDKAREFESAADAERWAYGQLAVFFQEHEHCKAPT